MIASHSLNLMEFCLKEFGGPVEEIYAGTH